MNTFWRLLIGLDLIGSGCVFYAGLTGNWYVGWFVWVIPLTVVIGGKFALNILSTPDKSP